MEQSGVRWLALETEGVEVGCVFLGTHAPRLDEKGRLFLPAKFREELAAGLVITKGQEHCLYVFPEAEFLRLTEAMKQGSGSLTQKGARDYVRLMYATAFDQVPDRQGRISVPAPLRIWANLTRECTVIGANTRVEIWDSASWDVYAREQEQQFAELSEEVLPGL